jgi:hypothetical protein
MTINTKIVRSNWRKGKFIKITIKGKQNEVGPRKVLLNSDDYPDRRGLAISAKIIIYIYKNY